MSTLKPCPFCGGKRAFVLAEPCDPEGQSEEWVFVACRRIACGARGPVFLRSAAHQNPDPEVQAVNAWNNRTAV